MPDSSFQGMQLVSREDLERILKVTDSLQLHRDWVVVPIDALPEGREAQLPDGKLIVHAPVKERFEEWLAELPSRLMEFNLGAVPRPTQNDPKWPLTGSGEIKLKGTRGYLGTLGIVR